MLWSTHAAQIGSYTGSLYDGWLIQRVGIITPRSPWSAAHAISSIAASWLCRIGTSATPTRRSGLSAHSSASQRLCALAPSITSTGSLSPDEPSPAPNGVPDTPPTPAASASGKITSQATPSPSSSLSRMLASHEPRMPPWSSISSRHSATQVSRDSDGPMRALRMFSASATNSS